ncbi:MAG: T9SS type A sorting domain-containing protein, partial [Vicingaceae bacterium]|nr:T9SS type A sorting domain-containing protein [Vicingaceae bacterium]
SENFTETYCSNVGGDCIQFVFTLFNTETCCDDLSIYDGPNTGSPLIGNYAGTALPNGGTITSTTGCLTFEWTSDGSVVRPGWEAAVSCVACPTCTDGILNGSETGIDCGGPTCPTCPCASLPVWNDELCCAILVPVNPDNLCAITTPGSVLGATPSSQSTTACGGTEDDDVWFSFVATGPSHYISLINIAGSTTDMYHSVWEGACPGAQTLVAGTCSDPNSQTVTGLTPGNTYYIRVYTWTGTAGQTSTFDLCVGTPPPPPANDDCGGAIALTVNPNQLCGTTTTSSVSSATPSVQNTGSCGGTEDDDVWFSFVATSSTHYIDLLNITGSTTDMYHSVWEGVCPALTLVAGSCSDPNSSTLTTLTPGNTYYVRVYTWTGTAGQTSVFDICIGSPPTPTCTDGIQNQGETGVDCGGPCPACPPPSCTDGIQNQGETGVDCGGPNCPACPPIINATACGNVTHNLTTGSSVSFYDDGGVGGDPCLDVGVGTGNYANSNCFTTTTICAPVGEFIIADFREFAMWNTTSGWDWMKIYDNNAASGTVLYDNSSTGPDNPMGDCGIAGNVLNYCSTGRCLTFEFWATSVVNRAGWDALVSAVVVQCVLPVEFINFSAEPHLNHNLLAWSTATEINNDYFILERSDNGIEFERVAQIDGAGNSNDLLKYKYEHKNPSKTEYYRLKQVDFDGKHSYSKIIVVNNIGEQEINIYPNPSKDNFSFEIRESSDELYTITYTNLLGMNSSERIQITEGINQYQVTDFVNLPNGIYFIQVINGNGDVIKSQKIIKN